MSLDPLESGRIRLIGVSGPAGCGKDTVAAYFAEAYGARIAPCAGPLKDGLNAMFGFRPEDWHNREWKERAITGIGVSPRHLAQTLGTEWGRATISDSVWIDLVVRDWKQRGRPLTVVPDVRFDNEAARIIGSGGVVISILRPGVKPVRGHASEAGISSDLIDATVANVGSFAALYRAAEDAVNGAVDRHAGGF